MAGLYAPIYLLLVAVAVPVLQGFPTDSLHSEERWQSQKLAHRRISHSADVLLESPSLPSHPDLTQVVTRRTPSLDHNLRQDPPPPTEDELQAPRRRRDAVADSEAEADDDSDMYLEPDDAPVQPESKPSEVVPRYEEGPRSQYSQEAQVQEVPRAQYYAQQEAPRTDNHGHAQSFFPSFAPVFSLGHSRPPQLYHPIGEESEFYKPQRSTQNLRALGEFNPFRSFREAFQPQDPEEAEASPSRNLLGSGNFGVIRGGTYYSDEDRNSYYNNGHGRPYFNNPLPQRNTGGDFFANFRDFADINVSPKASFSEFVIVYVNKNGTTPHLSDPARPKNIIEQLSLLDQQDNTPVPEKKKISSHKRKLSVLRKEQLEKEVKKVLRKKETAKDFHDPLLALS